ncbi:hypothetical protein C0J09_11060 [Bordetella avium]|uniref:hypothetical protein n=1 Tax=Bordetella avium TaxID=521 RepID=UPI000FDCCD58|nr:hypothetical protein [Bordetella avium]AZY49616.1 hypothetical protein C0J09_11060 [Bordetella avium]
MTNIADEVLDAPAEIKQYSPIESGLAKLREQYAGVVFDVSSAKGLEDAKAARQAIRLPRYELEKLRKALKAPALEYSKRIDSEAKRIEAELLALETPLDEAIKAEEARKEEIKAAKAREELARQQAIQQRLDNIRGFAMEAVGLSSAEVLVMRDTLAEFAISTELYEHRAGEAMQLQTETIDKLNQMHAAALAQETEAARLAAERAALERQRQEQEAAAAAARKAEDERLAKERAELAEQQRRLQAERDAENARQEEARAEQARKDAEAAAEIKRQKDAAAAELRANKEAIERQFRELEAQQEAARRAEQAKADAEARELREKEEAERRRIEAEAAAARAEEERRQRIEFELHGPGDAEIVRVLANHYRVSNGDVIGWLAKFNAQTIDQAMAA